MSHSRLTLILVLLAILFSLSVLRVSAQEPPKGPDPLPPTPPVSPVNIDPALLVKIEPQLLKNLLSADGGSVPFIVYMKEQADIAGAVAAIAPSIQTEPDLLTKRRIIVDELQRTARNSQIGVLQQLAAPPGLTGQAVTDVRSLWIVNAVAARGTLDTVLDLAARPDVAVVRLDKTIQLNRPLTSDSESEDQVGVGSAAPYKQLPEWGVEKIRANLVRNALGIDGSGVVVANIDTGVDWLHPDLQRQYRGYTGANKLPKHDSNWYDATNEGAVYPVDSQGHGTHTMGTAVGQNGIGVAPGARWIAVRAFNSNGTALNSWIHAAFQWLLAPAGDPALAPHIVNNSWSSNNGWSVEFQVDIQTLSDAGIFSVFSAGNNGPGSGTVGSPGSNMNAFSVGATNPDDSVASFSGRGPSPWGEIKPEVSAPGTNVRSTLPGGSYGTLSGTSMAAPHVAGLAALLLQASPTLSSNLTALAEALTATAVPLGGTVPNNNFGWGRVDAYNAVMSVTSAGTLSGVVSDGTTGTPLEAAVIEATPRLGGPTITTISGPDGGYLQGLAPDSYDVTASAFGYQFHPTVKVDILTGSTTVQNFGLAPQPSGYVAGAVSAGSTGLPLAATIRVDDTPVSTTTVNGQYRLTLPVGVYTVTVIAAEHRISSAVGITVSAGLTTNLSFVLDSAPSILVVDSGKWYDASQLTYFGQALSDARYPYDVWQITNPFVMPTDVPPAPALQQYDIVIWSSPFDSPGYIGADKALETFLDGGGKLLLSGQDVGFFDGGGFWGLSASYYSQYLKAKFVKDSSETAEIVGVENEPFAGLSFTINGGDGANNQLYPDVIALTDPDFAGKLLQYGNNELAGLYVGLWCLPYRALYLSFGLEGISSRADRQTVMEDSIDLLLQPEIATRIDLSPPQATAIGNFASTVSHSLRLRNTGATTDVITLTKTARGPNFWPTTVIPSPVVLPSCQSQYFTVTVQIPATSTWHISDTFTVAAQSGKNPALSSVVTRTTKTPAPLLLVDDDRWYSFADQYKEALTANQIPYDFYFVPKSWSGVDPPSPSLETLQMYPMVVWYTAYDWFNPLTPNEEERLGNYLDGGGRLLFSSQDFLYRHLRNHGAYQPFVQNYLGVQAHTEDYTSTLVLGERASPVGSYLGPYPLNFPAGYRNFTDGLTPTLKAQAATVGHRNQINGITNAGSGSSGQQWRSTFLAYGAELLSPPDRAQLIRRATGWLGWLGDSQIEPETGTIIPGALITYTAVVSNNGWNDIESAHFTATLPAYLLPVTASPGVTLENGTFLWRGPLAASASHSFTFTALITQPLQTGTVISQTNWLSYDEHKILFDRISLVDVAPDFTNSSMHVTTPATRTYGVHQYDVLTYTIVLRNHGTVGSSMVTTTNSLPPVLKLIGIAPVDNGVVISRGNHLTWTTALARNSVATLTFMAQVTTTGTGLIRNVAEVEDGVNEMVILAADTRFDPGPIYLPIVVKNPTNPVYLPVMAKNQ